MIGTVSSDSYLLAAMAFVIVWAPLSASLLYRAAQPSSQSETVEIGLGLILLVLLTYGTLPFAIFGPTSVLLASVAFPLLWGGLGAVIGARRLVVGSLAG